MRTTLNLRARRQRSCLPAWHQFSCKRLPAQKADTAAHAALDKAELDLAAAGAAWKKARDAADEAAEAVKEEEPKLRSAKASAEKSKKSVSTAQHIVDKLEVSFQRDLDSVKVKFDEQNAKL
mmetsp:Transcript_70830/g.114174  ORF Transcript_70830/g.114174 Transcript_70830/m.114174 type:complete len:122 (-) Transcript_70830:18-383(-)